MYLDLPQANSRMYIEPQLGSPRPQYLEPLLEGYPSLGLGASKEFEEMKKKKVNFGKKKKKPSGSPKTPKQVVEFANSLATPLPAPIRSAIKRLPLTSKQKSALQNHPVSFFIVFADASQDKVIEFINRTQQMSGKSTLYDMGGRKVRVAPKKSDPPALLAAMFLTVANQNPAAAAQVSGAMMMETGGSVASAGFAAAKTAAKEAYKGAVKTGEQVAKGTSTVAKSAGKTAKKATKKAKKTAKKTKKFVESLNPFAGYQSLGGNYIGDYTALGALGMIQHIQVGIAAAAIGASAYAAQITMAEMVKLAAVSVVLAPILVPPLVDLGGGQDPKAAPASSVSAATMAARPGGEMDQVNNSLPADVQNMQMQSVAAQDSIFGLPRNVVIYGGGAVGIGLAAVFALKLFKKK